MSQGKTDGRLFAIEERRLGALIDTQLQMRVFGLFIDPRDSQVHLGDPDLAVVLRDGEFTPKFGSHQ